MPVQKSLETYWRHHVLKIDDKIKLLTEVYWNYTLVEVIKQII